MQAVQTVVVVGLGAFIFDRLKIPAGALIGGMLAAIALSLSPIEIQPMPGWFRFVAYAGLGWLLGEQFTQETLSTLREALLPVALVVATLVAGGVVLTFALKAMGVDGATAFLSSSPAGITQMAALSSDLGANSAIVVATHLVRTILIVGAAPVVARWLTGEP